MSETKKVKVKLTLDPDALLLLNEAVTPRKRGVFVSSLIRSALGEEMTTGDVIAALQRYEKTLARL